jgi:hypothetical protein
LIVETDGIVVNIEQNILPDSKTDSIKIISEHSLPCQSTKKDVFLTVNHSGLMEKKDILHFILRIIQKERKLHPLFALSCSDAQKTKSIDKLWSDISQIDSDRLLDCDLLQKQNFKNFIWLQEIYLSFGWHDELNHFYTSLNKNKMFKDLPAIKITRQRYLDVSKKEIKNANKTEDLNKTSLLSIYLGINKYDDVRWREAVQKKWEELHFPILRLKLLEDVRNNPDEWIAFVFLAFEGDFWWKEQLLNIVSEVIDSAIFKLLIEIKSIIKIVFQQHSVILLPGFNYQLGTNLSFSNRDLFYSRNSKLKRTFSSFRSHTNHVVEIDQDVGFEVSKQNRVIKILPSELSSDFEDFKINYMELSFNNDLIQVPLIWNQYTVFINNCRLKFLKKKDRFQITVRFKNKQDKLKIDNKDVDIPNNNVTKIYYPISRQPGKIYTNIYNSFGVRTSFYSGYNSMLIIAAIAIDSYGILHREIKFMNNDSSRYTKNMVKDNEIYALNLNHIKHDISITLSSKHSQPKLINIGYKEGYSDKIFYSHISDLLLSMVIYMNLEDEQGLSDVKKACNQYLGFVPMIEDITSNKYRSGIFGIIIEDGNKQEITADYVNFKVIKLGDNLKINYIHISKKNAKNMFSNEFFNNYLSKI